MIYPYKTNNTVLQIENALLNPYAKYPKQAGFSLQ